MWNFGALTALDVTQDRTGAAFRESETLRCPTGDARSRNPNPGFLGAVSNRDGRDAADADGGLALMGRIPGTWRETGRPVPQDGDVPRLCLFP